MRRLAIAIMGTALVAACLSSVGEPSGRAASTGGGSTGGSSTSGGTESGTSGTTGGAGDSGAPGVGPCSCPGTTQAGECLGPPAPGSTVCNPPCPAIVLCAGWCLSDGGGVPTPCPGFCADGMQPNAPAAPCDGGETTCVGYRRNQCIWGCSPDLPDGGCDCGGGIVDPKGRCAECAQDSDCDGGLHCDLDPMSFAGFETCVGCTEDGQCGAGRVCDPSRNGCVPDCRLAPAACSAGCSAGGVCGECAGDADCPAGTACARWPDGGMTFGIPPTCRNLCRSDADCPPLHPSCDAAPGYCVDCLEDSDCRSCRPFGGSCHSGSCVDATVCY